MKRIKSLLNEPLLVDGPNIYKPEDMRELGFVYRGVGRALMKAADDEAKLLTVDASVNSVMAFMRYGFMPCGADQIAAMGMRFMPMKRA